jgi:hypothetical protein
MRYGEHMPSVSKCSRPGEHLLGRAWDRSKLLLIGPFTSVVSTTDRGSSNPPRVFPVQLPGSSFFRKQSFSTPPIARQQPRDESPPRAQNVRSQLPDPPKNQMPQTVPAAICISGILLKISACCSADFAIKQRFRAVSAAVHPRHLRTRSMKSA